MPRRRYDIVLIAAPVLFHCLFGLGLQAAPAQGPAFVPYKDALRLYECEIPKSLAPQVTVEAGIRYLRLSPEPLSHIDIAVYPLSILERFAKVPPGFVYAASLLQMAGTEGFRLVKPLQEGRILGYPSWVVLREYSQRMPVPGRDDRIETREAVLVIQRKTHFLVIDYKTRPALFREYFPVTEHVLATLQLLPEPLWATPEGLLISGGAGVFVLLMLLVLIWKLLRKKEAAEEAPEESEPQD
jgi:hypothetical protein